MGKTAKREIKFLSINKNKEKLKKRAKMCDC